MQKRLVVLIATVLLLSFLLPGFTDGQQAAGQELRQALTQTLTQTTILTQTTRQLKTLVSAAIGVGGKTFDIAGGGFYLVSKESAATNLGAANLAVPPGGFSVTVSLAPAAGYNVCDIEDFKQGIACYRGVAKNEAIAGANVGLEGAVGFDYVQNQTTNNIVVLVAEGGLLTTAEDPLPTSTKQVKAESSFNFVFLPNRDRTGEARVDLKSQSGEQLATAIVKLVDIFPPLIILDKALSGDRQGEKYELYFASSSSQLFTGRVNDLAFSAPDGVVYPGGGLKQLTYNLLNPETKAPLASGKVDLTRTSSFRFQLTNLPTGISLLNLKVEDQGSNLNELNLQILQEGDASSLEVVKAAVDTTTIDTTAAVTGSIAFNPPTAFYEKDQKVTINLSLPKLPSPPQRVEILLRRGGRTGEIVDSFREVLALENIYDAKDGFSGAFTRSFVWDISDLNKYRPGLYTVVVNSRSFSGQDKQSILDYVINVAKVSNVLINDQELLPRENLVNALQIRGGEAKPIISGRALISVGTALTGVKGTFFWGDSNAGAASLTDTSLETGGRFVLNFADPEQYQGPALLFNNVYRLELSPLTTIDDQEYPLPVFVTSVYFLRPQTEADDNPPLPEGADRFLPSEELVRVTADGRDHYRARIILVDAFGNTIPGAEIKARSGAAVLQDAYDIDLDQVSPGFDGSALLFSDFKTATGAYPNFSADTNKFVEIQASLPNQINLDPRTLRYELGLASVAPTVDDRTYRSLIKDGSFTATNHANYWQFELVFPPAQPLLSFQPELAGIKSFVADGDAVFMQPGAVLTQDLVDINFFSGQVFQVHLWVRRIGGAEEDDASLELNIQATTDPANPFAVETRTIEPIRIPFSGEYEEFFFPFTIDSRWQNARLRMRNAGDTIIALGKVRVEEAGKNMLKGKAGEKVIDLKIELELSETGGGASLFAVDTDLPLATATPSNPNIKGTKDPLSKLFPPGVVDHGHLTFESVTSHGISVNFQPALLLELDRILSLAPPDVDPSPKQTPPKPAVLRGDERARFRVTLTGNSSPGVKLNQIKLREILEFDTKFEAGFSAIIFEQWQDAAGKMTELTDLNPGVNSKEFPLLGADALNLAPGEQVQLFFSAIPFAPLGVRELRGIFDTALTYQLADPAGAAKQALTINYPGLALPVESLFGLGQVRVDIEEELLRESLLLSILETAAKEPTELIGDFTVEKLRELVDKNVNSLVRGSTDFTFGTGTLNIGSQIDFANLFSPGVGAAGQNAWLSAENKVAFIKGSNVILGDLNNPGASFNYPAGVRTLIVEGGNVIIAANFKHELESDSFGLIVRRSRLAEDQPIESDLSLHRLDKVPGGNIFLHPGVTNLEGSFYAEGLFLSYDGKVNSTPENLTSLWNSLHYHDRFDGEPNDSGENLIASGPQVDRYPATLIPGIYPVAEASRLDQLGKQLYFRGTLVTGQGEGITYRNTWNGSKNFNPNDPDFALVKVLDLARMREFQGEQVNQAVGVPKQAIAASVIIEKDQRLFREETIPAGFKLSGISWEEL